MEPGSKKKGVCLCLFFVCVLCVCKAIIIVIIKNIEGVRKELQIKNKEQHAIHLSCINISFT